MPSHQRTCLRGVGLDSFSWGGWDMIGLKFLYSSRIQRMGIMCE